MPDEADPPAASKLTRSKERWAHEGRFLTDQVVRPGAGRLPPGQHLVARAPVLDLGLKPDLPRAEWRLTLRGLVEAPLALDWAGFLALPQARTRSDIHCVTTWSRYDNVWDGVPTRVLLDAVRPRPEARFVLLRAYDGYTTNLPLADFAAEDAILAHAWDGAPLAPEHGGPVRLVVPHLYFWKSAKWLQAIAFTAEDRPGFWEERGYHARGDPWGEQRYADDA